MRKIVPSEALRTGWQLIHDAKNVGREEKWFNGIPEAAAVKAEVPGFVHTYLPDCLGVAWYQLRFRTGLHPDADHVVTLNFGMADWLCEVYLNRRMVGVHRGNENAFFFDVTDGNEIFRAGLHGGMGINTMAAAFLDKYGLSYSCRDDFLKAMDRLNEEKVDIFLGNHMQHNHTLERREKVLAGDKYAFVNKTEWVEYNKFCKENLLNMIAQENKK